MQSQPSHQGQAGKAVPSGSVLPLALAMILPGRRSSRCRETIDSWTVTLGVGADLLRRSVGGHHDGKNRDADPGAWPGRLWDVALSFAGPQRNYVEQIAEALKQRGAPRRSCSLAGLCETPGRPGSDDTLAAFMAWFLLGLVPSFAGWCVLRRRIVQDTCLPDSIFESSALRPRSSSVLVGGGTWSCSYSAKRSRSTRVDSADPYA